MFYLWPSPAQLPLVLPLWLQVLCEGKENTWCPNAWFHVCLVHHPTFLPSYSQAILRQKPFALSLFDSCFRSLCITISATIDNICLLGFHRAGLSDYFLLLWIYPNKQKSGICQRKSYPENKVHFCEVILC